MAVDAKEYLAGIFYIGYCRIFVKWQHATERLEEQLSAARNLPYFISVIGV
jgi:hypothetical protein